MAFQSASDEQSNTETVFAQFRSSS